MADSKDLKSVQSFSPEEFEFETRYVVLNFLGLVPAVSNSSSLNISRGSSSSESKKSGQIKGANGSRKTPAEDYSLNQFLPNLPEMSLNDKIQQHDTSSGHVQIGNEQKHHLGDDFDDDDTVYRSATKITSKNEESEDEVTIPVKMALTPDSLDSLEIVKSASNSKISDNFISGTCDSVEDSMFFPPGGSVPSDLLANTGETTPETEESLDGVDSSVPFVKRDRFTPERPSSLQDLVPAVSPPKPYRSEKSKSPSKHRTNLARSATMDSERPDINKSRSPKVKRADSQRSPKPGFQSQLSGSSHMSELSEQDSLMMSSVRSYSSRGSNYVDICQIDIDTMVKTKAMPEMMKELKEEIEEEMVELDQQYEAHAHGDNEVPAPVSRSMSLSPESKVAQYLSVIGDNVQEKYGKDLEMAFQTVVNQPTEDVDYTVVSEVAGNLVQNTYGWTKVALLMLLGKKLTYGLLSQGRQGTVVHNMVSHTTRLLEDQVADFIISKGGWNSIRDIDEIESCTSDYSPHLDEYDQAGPPLIGDGPINEGTIKSIPTSDTKIGATNNISPDKNTSSQMTTSLHSEASFQSESSTLVDSGHENIIDGNGIGRDTSSETLPLSIFSPSSESDFKSNLDDRLSNNNDIIKSEGVSELMQGATEEGNCTRNLSERSFGFSVHDDFNNLDYASSSDDGSCFLRPRYNTSTSADRHNLVEGTLDMDSAVENIQRELTLLRQISTQYSDNGESERQKREFQKKVGLGIVIGAVVLIGIMYVYKNIKK